MFCLEFCHICLDISRDYTKHSLGTHLLEHSGPSELAAITVFDKAQY